MILEGDDEDFTKRIAWEILYRTVVDCYKFATKQSGYFKYGTRYKCDHERKKVLEEARQEIEAWITSDRFAFYAKEMGFNPKRALTGLQAVLEGDKAEELDEMIKYISQSRFNPDKPKRQGDTDYGFGTTTKIYNAGITADDLEYNRPDTRANYINRAAFAK